MGRAPRNLWDRLPLRLKGAVIVGAPIAALLAGAVTSFWFDRQSDAREAKVNQAIAARDAIDHVGHEVDGVALALQRYTLTEDPDSLPEIDRALLADVRELRRLRDPRTGEPFPAVEQASATVPELLLTADSLAQEMASADEATERQEDALDLLSERLTTMVEVLALPQGRAEAAAAAYQRELTALEEREGSADAVMLLVGLLGGLAAVAFFARSFARRIADLGTAAEHLAAGDFTRAFPRGSDEIGVLGERLYGAFNDLRASEEHSQLILETSADAYVSMDENWIVNAWNRAAESIFGWTKEEAIGRPLVELVMPERFRALHVEDLAGFLSNGDSSVVNRRVEAVAIHKDGHEMPIDLAVVPVESGHGLTFHSFVRDLTTSKKAEEETTERARRMAEIIQTMSDMASAEMDVRRLHELLLDRARSLTGADGAALQLEHQGRLKIVAGVGPVAAHVGRELDIETSMTGRTLTSGKTFVTGDVARESDVDAPLARDIGTRSTITVPLADADRVVGVLAVHAFAQDAFGDTAVTDLELLGGFFGAVISKIQAYVAREVVVRERTQALGELRELHDELAEKNAALVAATEEANAANHAKSEFLSRMSHELRTPLNAILGFTQLLQTEPLEPDQLDSLGHIEGAGRHLLALINEVLEIARIESGNAPLSLGHVALGPLVQETVDLIRPLAAQRGISVRLTGSSDGSSAWADAQKVKQILLNLLSNAVKYNRVDGEVHVTLDSGEDAIRIAVSDTGAGIAPEKVRSLFTPFDRLGAERTVVEGTGLGLAVSKTLAEAMGGDLSCETLQGSGSTFVLQLTKSEPGSPLPHADSPPASRGAPARDPRRVVLYVEDNASNARLVERALNRRPDVELRVATTGRAGLAAAAALRPSLILLDMDLPDASGIEVLRRLREGAAASTPVLMLSADATSDQARAALDAGADGYLTKPVDLCELLRTIDSYPGAVERAGAR